MRVARARGGYGGDEPPGVGTMILTTWLPAMCILDGQLLFSLTKNSQLLFSEKKKELPISGRCGDPSKNKKLP